MKTLIGASVAFALAFGAFAIFLLNQPQQSAAQSLPPLNLATIHDARKHLIALCLRDFIDSKHPPFPTSMQGYVSDCMLGNGRFSGDGE